MDPREASATSQVELPGIPPYHVLDVSKFDSIDALTGNLHFEIPLFQGQVNSGFKYELKLAYNSAIWQEHLYPFISQRYIFNKGHAGVGFTLNFGRIYKYCNDYYQSCNQWYYQDASGTIHALLQDSQAPNDYYTVDTTKVRARQLRSSGTLVRWDLWLPDGTKYEMGHERTLSSDDNYFPVTSGWYTSWIRSPVQGQVNWVKVEYSPSQSHIVSRVEDSLGRVINITASGTQINAVDVPAFGGRRAVYQLEYQSISIKRPYNGYPNPTDDGPLTQSGQAVVTRLVLPEPGYSMTFDYGPGSPNTGGVIRKLTFPSQAVTEYGYVVLPKLSGWASPSDVDAFAHGVSSKRLTLGSGESYLWQYGRSYENEDGSFAGWVVRTEITDPFGNRQKHYFHAQYQLDGGADQFNGLCYKIHYHHGSGSSANLVRSEYLGYRTDGLGPGWIPWNSRLQNREVVHRDGPTREQRTANADWSGVHWREKREYDYSGAVYRITRTEYTTSGAKGTNWILNTYTAREVRKGDGTPVQKSTFVFNDDGTVAQQRDRYNPSLESAQDVVTSSTYDPLTGNLDSVSVSDAGGAAPARTTLHRFEHGHLASRQVVELAWKGLDQTIDYHTGLAAAVRDTAAAETRYEYDLLGRPTEVVPPAGEHPTRITYPSASEIVVERGTPGTADYTRERRVFDGLSRLIRIDRLDESGGTVQQSQGYDGPSEHVAWRTEWEAIDEANPPRTTYSYLRPLNDNPGVRVSDPFGRLQEIVRPDGTRTTIVHEGLDRRETVHGVNNVAGEDSITWLRYDSVQRLIAVEPPAVAAKAVYGYDHLDHLVRVDLIDQSDGAIRQTRTRDYDALGRLRRSVDPESGEILYEAHDARGNVTSERRADGATFTHTYDTADRLLITTLRVSAGQSPLVMVTEKVYDEGPESDFGLSAGKLTTERSRKDSGLEVMTRRYAYKGLGGRLSGEITTIPPWESSGAAVELTTGYTYDGFGRRAAISYPNDGGPRMSTTVSYAFSYGHLASVLSNRGVAVSSISRHPSGRVESIVSGNGVESRYPRDAMGRPSRVQVLLGPTTYLDSGAFVYDSMGDVLAMGGDTFHYDLAGRLDAANIGGNAYVAGRYAVSYEYDMLGNLKRSTRMRTDEPGGASVTRALTVDAASNRLTAVDGIPVSHDENGNLLSDGLLQLGYDRRSRLEVTSGPSGLIGEYSYNVAGFRVVKRDRTASRSTLYVRDDSGSVLSEFSSPLGSSLAPHWNRDYIYSEGLLVAIVQNSEPSEPSWRNSSAGVNVVNLFWRGAGDPDHYGYNIYRSSTSGSSYVKLNSSPVLAESFSDTAPLHVGVQTYYVVTAIDSAGLESRFSAERMITPGDVAAPQIPTGLASTPSNSRVTLTWSANAEPDIGGYDVYRSQSADWQPGSYTKLNLFPVAGTLYEDLGLTNGATYHYRIEAVDTAGNRSPWSESVSATPTGGGGSRPDPVMRRLTLWMDGQWNGDVDALSAHRLIGTHSSAEVDWHLLFVHSDHLGSTRVVSNEAGLSVAVMHYFPFGEEIPPAAPRVTTRRFTGHERDDETRLDYMLARGYSPVMGRFLSRDPGADTDLDDPQSWNKFAYARNNPIKFVDPQGEAVETAWDLFNVGMGVLSLGYNLSQGNWWDAAFDAGGILVDGGASLIPGLPGGVASALRARRLASTIDDAIDVGRRVDDARGAGRATTDFVTNATVKSHGKVIAQGTVDVRGTVQGIESGALSPRNVFRNDEGLLPPQPPGYYHEYVHPTPGVPGAGPQRIVGGQGGELFYTPDHYETFVPLN